MALDPIEETMHGVGIKQRNYQRLDGPDICEVSKLSGGPTTHVPIPVLKKGQQWVKSPAVA